MELIKKQFNNQEISFDLSGQGMINATEMAKANGKLIANFFENKETDQYLEALSADIGIPISDLYVSKKGGNNQGTWVHRRLAIRIAQWCSAEFAVQVDSWIEELFLNGKVNLKSSTDNLVADFAEDRLKLAKMFGLEGNQALLSVNRTLIQEKNYDAIKALGIELISDVKAKTYTPTELGSRINLKAVQFNQLLEKKGLQVKRVHGKHTEWEPTEIGKPYCEVSDVGKKHSTGSPVKQIKWYESVLDELK